jgi:chromosome segregation ATPase
MTSNAQTLTERLAAGRLSHQEALRYSVQLVDALRRAHEEGRCHCALTADTVMLDGNTAELVPGPSDVPFHVTGYTAPEQLKGQPPDQQSDIFALGAIVYEIFTGRRAFPGDTPEELTAAIEQSTPEPTGDAALDRLVMNCLVKDPACRWQRVQQVHLELKIMVFSAKRGQSPAVPSRVESLQAQLQQLESRLVTRMAQQHGEAAAGLQLLSSQLPMLDSQLTARLEDQTHEVTAALRQMDATLPMIESRLSGRLRQHDETLSGLQQTVAAFPLVDPELVARLAHQSNETAAALQQLTGELPSLESRLASRLQAHEETLSGLRQTVAAIPQVDPELVTLLAQQSDETAVALRQIETTLPTIETRLSGLQQAVSAIPQVDPELVARLAQQSGETAAALQQLTGELPSLESRLATRLQAHDETLSSLQQAVSAIPQVDPEVVARVAQQSGETATALQHLTGELPARLQTHDDALSGLQGWVSSVVALESKLAGVQERSEAHSSQVEQHGAAIGTIQGELVEAKERVEQTAHSLAEATELNAISLEYQNATIETLQQATVEQKSALQSLASSLSSMQNDVVFVGSQVAALHEQASQPGALLGELQALGLTVQSHGAAIESIRASLARTDDFMERVVEALESLQTMVLDQARDRVVA